MSKLRADITYNHHLYNNTISEPTLDIDVNNTEINQNPENLENPGDNDPAANLEPNSEPIEDDSDEEITEPQLGNSFGEYLQGWAEMLEEEENAEFDDSDEENNTSLNDITHPANNTNAKWELLTLFKSNVDIGLPF